MALELCGPCPHCLCWPGGVTGTGGCHLGVQPWYVQVYAEAATQTLDPRLSLIGNKSIWKETDDRASTTLLCAPDPYCTGACTNTRAGSVGTRYNPVQGRAVETGKAQCP